MLYLIAYEIKPTPLPHRSGVALSTRRSTNVARRNPEEAITTFGNWWHYFSDMWIVDTSMTVDEIADAVRQHLAEQDYLLVIAIQPPYQGLLPKEAWDWINNSMHQRSSGYRSIR